MAYLAFLVASAAGAAGLVWSAWRHSFRSAIFSVLAALTAAIVCWLTAVPSFDGRAHYYTSAIALLAVAILLPGCVGAAMAHSSTSRWNFVLSLLLALLIWLPMAYFGLFTSCELDPRCDL